MMVDVGTSILQDPEQPVSFTAKAQGRPPPSLPQLSFAERQTRLTGPRPNLEPVLEGSTNSFGTEERPKQTQCVDPVLAARPRRLSRLGLGPQRRQQAQSALPQTDTQSLSQQARRGSREESMVLAEVQTNVIVGAGSGWSGAGGASPLTEPQVRNEVGFMTELAGHLSKRYSRSARSVGITVHHGICMFLAGSFEAAYTVSISALPSQLQPATNKRNLVLLQRHLETALGVPASRGFVRFIATAEECCGWDGRTAAEATAERAARHVGQVDASKAQQRRSVTVIPTRRGGQGHGTDEGAIPALSARRPWQDRSGPAGGEGQRCGGGEAADDASSRGGSQTKRVRNRRSLIEVMRHKYGRRGGETRTETASVDSEKSRDAERREPGAT